MKNNEENGLNKLKEKHEHIFELVNNPELPRTVSEQRDILKLELKGLEYVEKNFNTDLLLNNKDFELNNNLKLKLVEIGSLVEKQEYLIENNLDIEARVDNQLKLEELTNELEKDLGLTNKNEIDLPKPKPELKEDKEELDSENKPEPEPVQNKTNLNEELITQELVEKAKMDGDLKEVKLDSTNPTDNGQVGASLVVNLDEQKIANTIQNLEERLNPVNVEETNINKIANVEPKNKDESKSNKNSLQKPQPPKPTPNNTKKEDKKVEDPQPSINLNINAKIAELSAKFREQQENNPFILDQEKFDTVLKPQVPLFQDKNLVSKNIFAMRERSMNGATPDVVENNYGVEERKSTRRLKA